MATEQPSVDVRGYQSSVPTGTLAMNANASWNSAANASNNADTDGLLMKAYLLSMAAC